MKLLTGFLLVLLAACQTAPVASNSDMSFVHGCWIARHDPPSQGADTLRLLTMGVPNADYAGELLRYAANETELRAGVSFAQDGSRMSFLRPTDRTPPVRLRGTLTRTDAPALPAGWKRAVFNFYPETRDAWIIAEGGPEHLRIYQLFAEGPPAMIFDGARDGCD